MKIVVACDGSEHSERGLKLAAKIPFKSASFTLVNVVPEIEFDKEYFTDQEVKNIENYNKDLFDQSKVLLDKYAGMLKELGYDCQVISKSGQPAAVLRDLSKENDLIVMGTRGLNPVKGFFLGSVSDSVLRHGACSVLFSNPEPNAQEHKMNKVMLGFDDSASSLDATQFLNHLDLAKMEKVDVVSIMQTIPFYGMNYSLTALEFWPKYRAILEKSLKVVEKNLSSQMAKEKIHTEVIAETHDIADTLIKYSEDHQSDLMIVGSKGKTMMENVLIGSVSNRLAHHAKVPLLVVRPS